MSGIPAGSIVHVGGKTVLNRLQTAGLQDPKVPVQTVYETGNDLVVGKILTEADFRFQMTSWDVSTDLMALLTGETAAAIGDQISAADAVGTVYAWEDVGAINLTSPWKEDTGTQGGSISSGVIIPNLFPTALSYRLGVTDNAEMQVTLASGSYYMAQAMPLEEYAAGDGTVVAFQTANDARIYRIGGAGSTLYAHVFGVMVNGVQQIPGIDYTETDTAGPEVADAKCTITFAVPPPAAAIVKYCYFSDTAAAIPQSMNLDTTVVPAAVRGRDITLLVGDPADSPLALYGVQTFELQASVSGSLQRQMGTQDPIGFFRTGIDTTGTVTIEPSSQEKLYQFLAQTMGVDQSEVYGYINQYTFPLTAVIHDPKNPANIIKSIFVPDAFFQAPGENARVQTVTQFPITWESETGTFREVKGALPGLMPEQVNIEQAADVAANVGGVTLTVNTADEVIAAPDSGRERLVISANVADVWLGYGQTAVVGKGHCVRMGSPPFEERAWKGAVSMISTGAAVVGWTETVYSVGDDQGEEPTGAQTFTPSGPSDAPIAAPTSEIFGQ